MDNWFFLGFLIIIAFLVLAYVFTLWGMRYSKNKMVETVGDTVEVFERNKLREKFCMYLSGFKPIPVEIMGRGKELIKPEEYVLWEKGYINHWAMLDLMNSKAKQSEALLDQVSKIIDPDKCSEVLK